MISQPRAHIPRNSWMIMYNEFERTWMEEVVVYFKVLLQYGLEKYKKSGLSWFRVQIESGTPEWEAEIPRRFVRKMEWSNRNITTIWYRGVCIESRVIPAHQLIPYKGPSENCPRFSMIATDREDRQVRSLAASGFSSVIYTTHQTGRRSEIKILIFSFALLEGPKQMKELDPTSAEWLSAFS